MGGRIKPRFKTSKFDEEDGTLPKFTFEFPEGFCVLRDTREQGGLFRKPIPGLIVIREAIPIIGLTNRWADYTIKGFESVVIIEHKELDDLWTSLIVNGHDFKEKMVAMSKYERSYLVVNALESETLMWRSHRDIHPNSIRQALASIEGRIGVPIHYSESIQDAERWLLSWFIKFYLFKRGL